MKKTLPLKLGLVDTYRRRRERVKSKAMEVRRRDWHP